MTGDSVSYGKYQLLERIARGGMAEVYRAKSHGVSGFEKVLVIKRILPELARHTEFVEMFVNEAKIAVSLTHANIVQVFDLGFAEEGHVPALMDQVLISDHIRSTSQRFVYAYDFLHMWMFMVELIHASDPQDGVTYPRLVMSMGNAPGEHSKEEELAADLMSEDPYTLEDEEHHYDDDDGYSEEDEDHNEFGHGSIDDLGEEYR